MPHPPKSNRLYWSLQSVGWLIFGSVNFASLVSFNYTNASIPVIATMAVFGAAQLLLLTHLFRVYSKSRHWLQLGYLKLIPRLLLATFLIAVISQLSTSVVALWILRIFTTEEYSFFYLGVNIFQVEIWIALWTLIYFCTQYFRNYKNAEIEKWKLQSAVKDAELIALKAQINPHFIFNCLNNIRALVLEDPEKSREAITKLSDLLRCSIQFNEAEKVTIEQELTMVRDYLSLESIHMESRLQYTITLSDPKFNSFEIPPMSIQLLVENAIKHSLSKLPNGGSINIKIQNTNTALEIEVLNTGQIESPNIASTGIGLKNIRERLTLLYGPNASLTLENCSENSVRAKIVIP